jgi:hypothetical protein
LVVRKAAGRLRAIVWADLQELRDFTHARHGVRMVSPRHLAHVLYVTMVAAGEYL